LGLNRCRPTTHERAGAAFGAAATTADGHRQRYERQRCAELHGHPFCASSRPVARTQRLGCARPRKWRKTQLVGCPRVVAFSGPPPIRTCKGGSRGRARTQRREGVLRGRRLQLLFPVERQSAQVHSDRLALIEGRDVPMRNECTGAVAWLALGTLLPAMATGCSTSSSGSGAGRSGLNGSVTVSGLSDAQRKQFCDWTASLFGGYGKGKTKVCDDAGNVTASFGYDSQAECIGKLLPPPGCPATVAQGEDCQIGLAASDPCNPSFPASCAAFFTAACFGSLDGGSD